MEFIKLGSILGAGVITLALMLAHYASPHFARLMGLEERQVSSFAGGVAVAYVFLHMLPELVEGNESIGELLKRSVAMSPLFDLAVFMVALLGFTIYYGLELVAEKNAEDQGGPAWVYALHLGMYCLYNSLITYTMPLRVQTGWFFSIIFTVAMGLHFVMNDRGLGRHFPRRFTANGRFLLIGSLGLGWLITAVTDPINVEAVSLMIAFLSGSVLYNVFKEELPGERASSYPWFVCGLGLTSALLLGQAWLAAGGA